MTVSLKGRKVGEIIPIEIGVARYVCTMSNNTHFFVDRKDQIKRDWDNGSLYVEKNDEPISENTDYGRPILVVPNMGDATETPLWINAKQIVSQQLLNKFTVTVEIRVVQAANFFRNGKWEIVKK